MPISEPVEKRVVPTALPEIRLKSDPPLTSMPSAPLATTRLPVPANPTVFRVLPEPIKMPEPSLPTPLPRGRNWAGESVISPKLAPMMFPAIKSPVVKVDVRIPLPPFAEIRLPAPVLVPPIVLFRPRESVIPLDPFPRAAIPVMSVPT